MSLAITIILLCAMLTLFGKENTEKKQNVQNYAEEHPTFKWAEEYLLTWEYFLRTRVDFSKNPYVRAADLARDDIVASGHRPAGCENLPLSKYQQYRNYYRGALSMLPSKMELKRRVEKDFTEFYGYFNSPQFQHESNTNHPDWDEYVAYLQSWFDKLTEKINRLGITEKDLREQFCEGYYQYGFPRESDTERWYTGEKEDLSKIKLPKISPEYRKWLEQQEREHPLGITITEKIEGCEQKDIDPERPYSKGRAYKSSRYN